MILLARAALAALGGAMTYTSFAPLGWWPLGIAGASAFWAALAPWGRLRVELGVCRGALVGIIFCLGCYLLLFPWVGEFVGAYAYLALAVALAVSVGGLCGAGGALLARHRFGYLLFPFWVCAVEWLISRWPFGGFPWARWAWGQVDGPLASLARWGGPTVVTAGVVLTGTATVTLLLDDRGRRGRAVVAVVPFLAGIVGTVALAHAPAPIGSQTVAAIQGNVPRMGLDFAAQRRAVLMNHVREGYAAIDSANRAGTPLDMMVWPENASDVNPLRDPEAARLIQGVADAAGAPLMVGTVSRDEVGERNTMLRFTPGAPPPTAEGLPEDGYHYKKYLQPFGETMPLREFAGKIFPLVERAGDFQPGTGDGVIRMGEVPVGVATCYEVIFDDAYRDAVAAGARLLATPTNNATFGFTNMTYQQLAISRMRAIETDRAVVVAATSGVSAMVAPDGTVLSSSHIFEHRHLIEALPVKDSITPAVRYGSGVENAAAIIGLASVAGALVARRKKR